MLLVVIYHTPPRYAPAYDMIWSNLGVPIFFFAAGYLFDINKFSSFWALVKRRARQILVPYVTFFIVFYALWLLVGRTMAGPEEQAIPLITPLRELIAGTPHVVLATFWFLACLFSMQLIYYPLRRYLPGCWPLAVALVLSLSLVVMPQVPWLSYWNVDHAMLYMPTYAAGNCLKPWLQRIAQGKMPQSQLLLWGALALVALVALIVLPIMFGHSVAYIIAPEAVIVMLPALVAAAGWVERRFGPSRVAQNVAITTITYLALQNYLIGIIKIVATRLAGPDVFFDHPWIKIPIALAVMAALYPIALLIERYAPFMLGKRKQT